jgi:NAD(P)-dependent dehydrogenase (short-subunit alcohol dehydrogenase family)
MGRLDEKVAIVTGAGSGIGAASARLLARHGAAIVVADVDGPSAERVASEIRTTGGQAVGTVTDVGDEIQVQRMIVTAVDKWGRLDVLHNNAAATDAGTMAGQDTVVTEIDADVWDRVMQVNLRGCWLGCKHAIPVMVAGGGGSIVNTSSGAAIRGDLMRTAYGVSKAAINTLTLYVAAQYGRDNIRCNAIMPGVTMTPATRANMTETQLRSSASRIPLPRFGTAEDQANMVLFLASDEASYVTGQVLYVDGGLGNSRARFVEK